MIADGSCAGCAASAEGVLQAEKDHNKPKHSEELPLPNLQVIKLMQSFKSQELVTERFAWRHYYWCAASPQAAPHSMHLMVTSPGCVERLLVGRTAMQCVICLQVPDGQGH